MIAVCPNPFRDHGCKLALEAKSILENAGYECCICPVFSDNADDVLPAGLDTQKLSSVLDSCTLALVIGGDGTILNVARQFKGRSVPLLGIDLGTMGFLCGLEPEELSLIERAAAGDYTLSRRMMLDVELVRDGEIICRDFAINDAVVHGYGDCIKTIASCDGDNIAAFNGDGIILSTPTGSTGYSMSAGGPIVEPEAQAIILTPICAHMLGAKSFVLGRNRELSIVIEKLHGRRAYLSVDGNFACELCSSDRLIVRRSESQTLMADMGLRNFYEIAFDKLR